MTFYIYFVAQLPRPAWSALLTERPQPVPANWCLVRTALLAPSGFDRRMFGRILDEPPYFEAFLKRTDEHVELIAQLDEAAYASAAALASLGQHVARAGGIATLLLLSEAEGRHVGCEPDGFTSVPFEDELPAKIADLERLLSGLEAIDPFERRARALTDAGAYAEARALTRAYVERRMTARALMNYCIALRKEPLDADEARDACAYLLEAFRDNPHFTTAPTTLSEATAVLNTYGHARETVELALTGLDLGLEPTASLVINSCYSAFLTKDRALQRRFIDAVSPRAPEELTVFEARGWVYMDLGDLDQAFAMLDASLQRNPSRRREIARDPDWKPLHDDSRWAARFG